MPLYFDYTFNMHTCILSNIKKNSCTKLNNRLIIQSNKFLYKGFLQNEHLLIPSYIFFSKCKSQYRKSNKKLNISINNYNSSRNDNFFYYRYSSLYVVNTQNIILQNLLNLLGLIFINCQISFICTRRYNFMHSFLYT